MLVHEGDRKLQITDKSLGILDVSHPFRKFCINFYHHKLKRLLDIVFILSFMVAGSVLDYSTLESRPRAMLKFDKNLFVGFMYCNTAWVFGCAVTGLLP